ncbi:hypothetical protein HYZ78_01490 [Candidatus Microgenomates bacterium]|nr:hypothetical protein [Candidatus Microgenomates bacterium]
MARRKKAVKPKVARVPQVSRVSRVLLWAGAIIILLAALSNLGLWARNEYAKWQREPIETEIKQWEEVVEKTPTYRDGYLKLATLYWKLRQDDKAKAALERAKEIDPNYDATYELEQKLGY